VAIAVAARFVGVVRIFVRSLAVSLVVRTSPPPETVAMLVTADAALLSTLTVSVIGG
jgi:hypothetical protein